MMRTLVSLVSVLTLAVLLCACSTSPTASFYTLGAATVQQDVYTVRPISVVVTSVTVPDLVDRPQFVIRVSENQVKLDEYSRWADSLKSQIPRVVAADLSQYLQGARVSVNGQADDTAAAYRVRIDIQRFDGAPGDAASVEALWSVSPPKGAASLSGRTVAREPCNGADAGALAAAYSRALDAVSRDIAGAIHSRL
ncbi:PqiC family protein [Paraburkholderia sediminicola]|uniref:PqiC family protein n=1 Tax=Paraburkholderia sediminicola TaxID=458836 RepID=UPI000EAF8D64